MEGSMMGEKAARGWWHNSEGEAGCIEKKAGVRPLLLFSASPVKMREALKLCVWVSLLHRRKA